ncbi:MAG: class I SAM-dependent methyltransferase [Gemmatimonas sp.]
MTAPATTALGEALRRRIAADGPMTVGTFMAACLTHPDHGYYTTRDPLGRAGDFTTAPEISQMFGELIGAWCAVMWETMGKPAPFALVELGPGRGTMMADALRAVKGHAEFVAAARLHLVEASPALRTAQEHALGHHEPLWFADLGEIPPGPMIVVANEFFDALPIEQFVRRDGLWRRRVVGVDAGGALAMQESSDALRLDDALDEAADGTIAEMSPAAQATAFEIGGRLRDHRGAALILDFGRDGALGESLQALRGHASEPVLAHPGEADLAAHVDFRALARAATMAGARAFGPVPQGAFLKSLGIDARAEALARREPSRAAELALAVTRLTGARAMGRLFQALALTSADLAAPPGAAPPGFEGAPVAESALIMEDGE